MILFCGGELETWLKNIFRQTETWRTWQTWRAWNSFVKEKLERTVVSPWKKTLTKYYALSVLDGKSFWFIILFYHFNHFFRWCKNFEIVRKLGWKEPSPHFISNLNMCISGTISLEYHPGIGSKATSNQTEQISWLREQMKTNLTIQKCVWNPPNRSQA